MYQAFVSGEFGVHVDVAEGRYNGVWTDLALEQTYKEGKTSLFKEIMKSGATRDKYIKSLSFFT